MKELDTTIQPKDTEFFTNEPEFIEEIESDGNTLYLMKYQSRYIIARKTLDDDFYKLFNYESKIEAEKKLWKIAGKKPSNDLRLVEVDYLDKRIGYFHCWSIETEIVEKQVKLNPVGLVEMVNGKILSVSPENIRFLD